jgi:hypothetical protein
MDGSVAAKPTRSSNEFSVGRAVHKTKGWEMRRYDDPVEVRRGEAEGPEQFLWRGRLWKVYAVVAHWVETGPWWQSADAKAVLGAETTLTGRDLTAEREVWRVEAGRGIAVQDGGKGVFDLSFDWAKGDWHLARAVD